MDFEHWPPVLQAFACLGALAGGIFAWAMGTRKRADLTYPPEQYYFNGPVVQVLERLTSIHSTLTELRVDMNRINDDEDGRFDEYRRIERDKAERMEKLGEQMQKLIERIDRMPRRG